MCIRRSRIPDSEIPHLRMHLARHGERCARVELEVFVVAKSVALELFLSGDLCAANRNTILLERPGVHMRP